MTPSDFMEHEFLRRKATINHEGPFDVKKAFEASRQSVADMIHLNKDQVEDDKELD
jgi:hypothetical protein